MLFSLVCGSSPIQDNIIKKNWGINLENFERHYFVLSKSTCTYEGFQNVFISDNIISF